MREKERKHARIHATILIDASDIYSIYLYTGHRTHFVCANPTHFHTGHDFDLNEYAYSYADR